MLSSPLQLASAPVQETNPAASSKMVTGIQLHAKPEGTIPVQETDPAASSKMVTGIQLHTKPEGTIPVQETDPAASSKMVAGTKARASLQPAGGGVFPEPWVSCPRYDRGCPLHKKTGQGCSMLVTPRATRELGTQQGATLVLTVSTGVTIQQEADHLTPSIILPGIPGAKPGSSVEHTHVLCSEAVEEVNPQETSMLVTGHENREDHKKR